MSEPYFHPKFSRRSWHHRLYVYRYRRITIRISICRYFWSVVGAVLTVPLVALKRNTWDTARHATQENILTAIRDILVGVLVSSLALIVYHVVFLPNLIKIIIVVFSILAMPGLVLVGAWGFVRLFEWVERTLRTPKLKPPEKPRQQSLVKEYLRARKSRICPYVEWVNEK